MNTTSQEIFSHLQGSYCVLVGNIFTTNGGLVSSFYLRILQNWVLMSCNLLRPFKCLRIGFNIRHFSTRNIIVLYCISREKNDCKHQGPLSWSFDFHISSSHLKPSMCTYTAIVVSIQQRASVQVILAKCCIKKRKGHGCIVDTFVTRHVLFRLCTKRSRSASLKCTGDKR